MTTYKLTRRGKKARLDGLHPESILLMEIFRRLDGARREFDTDNISDLVDQLVERYGSIESAIIMVKSGRIGFAKDE
jgi:hypothetical protein